jgi:hypothetical protein
MAAVARTHRSIASSATKVLSLLPNWPSMYLKWVASRACGTCYSDVWESFQCFTSFARCSLLFRVAVLGTFRLANTPLAHSRLVTIGSNCSTIPPPLNEIRVRHIFYKKKPIEVTATDIAGVVLFFPDQSAMRKPAPLNCYGYRCRQG